MTNFFIKDIITKKFKQYCGHSTLHGLYYFHDSRPWWVYATWSSIVASSFALCIFLGETIWQKYILDPTITVVESTNYPMEKIPFPAVLLCDKDSVYEPNTENISRILNLRGFSNEQIKDFYRSFQAIKDPNYVPVDYVYKIHALLEDLGYTYLDLLNEFKNPCDEFLSQCIWRSNQYNCTEMFRQVFTVVGYCCQFDMTYFRQNVILEESGIQLKEGLDVTLHPQNFSETSIDGEIQLFIIDKKDLLTFYVDPVIITSATFFDISIDTFFVDASVEVKKLPMASRKCVLETENVYGANFYEGCFNNIMLKRTIDYCKCLPFNYTAENLEVEEFMPCAWKNYICVYRELDKLKNDLGKIISEEVCYQRCDYVQYNCKVDFISKQRKSNILQDDHSRFIIHFSSIAYMKYRREIIYTWDQMLANFGGIFGLCLGGSLISVFELVWLLMDVTCSIIQTRRKNNVTKIKEKNKNKIYVLKSNRNFPPRPVLKKPSPIHPFIN